MKSNRRTFLSNSSLLMTGARAALAVPFVATAARSAGAAPVADTTYGKLRGRTENGVHVFRGVPYGADTSGKNRFMPPQKPAPWKDVREAVNWGHLAPQSLASGNYDYTHSTQWAIKPGGPGEDCLVLNVTTTGLKDGGKRPVMFSIHGGGFTSGTSHNPVFDGTALAKMGAVVVTINHRLGALGYLHLGDLAPEFAQSGVVGMMDIVLALQWVKENIEAFGGDPGRVMIFGQSGGGSKVCHLMAMPSAKGLFHRAAIQSGAALRSGTKENAARSAERLMAQLSLPKARFRELQQMPYEFLIGAGGASGAQFSPVVDGTVMPRDPFDPDAPAVSADVPMLGGSNSEDSNLSRTNFALDEAAAQAEAKTALGNDADKIWKAYRAAAPKLSPANVLARIASDRGVRANTRTVIERKAALGKAPSFLYLLKWPAPFMDGRYGSVHGTDVPLIFHNPELWPLTAGSADGKRMADYMAGAFFAFAKTGNPSTPEVPWPAYTPAQKPTMVFDTKSGAQNDPDHELLAMLPPGGGGRGGR
ncbi:MAG: carboxylesterase family protein [Candidatus Solibacter sp.]